VLDIINLLPDNIANQIAAGEVIQRPASAVKELLENAVDAGATKIQLIINDAGKSLIQVIDNGNGMSETDARMAFERHATSKIKKIEDLFSITTMGFRGEALASIAAVSQVEIKTKKESNDVGTYLEIENSKVIKQEPCACNVGTSISMKNLFFNVPARRNFLKSNAAELKHIIDEFIRVSMAFPTIFFSFTCNGQQIYHLESGNIKQRVLQILGNNYSSKLVNVNEETDYLNINGFVGKPETARKTRGDQYFFVNNRFIKSAYLNHAINAAFDSLLPKDSFPSYVLFIDLNPEQIDINVHPTKQEIKFEDEKIIYAFVQSAVRHALAQFSIAPSLDFSLNANIQSLQSVFQPFTTEKQEAATATNLYKSFTQKHQAHAIEPNEKSELKHWKSFFEKPMQPQVQPIDTLSDTNEFGVDLQLQPKQVGFKSLLEAQQKVNYIQLHNNYILAPTEKGFLLIHQQLAHERVLYEQFSIAAYKQQPTTQKILFPITLELTLGDAMLLNEMIEDVTAIGFEIENFGNNSFIIQGTPADVKVGSERESIELLLDQLKHFSSDIRYTKREKLIRCMAIQQSIKTGQSLSQKEMQELVGKLFACTTSNVTANGNPIYIDFKEDYLSRLFEK
jgi:DNA mismatch repair protein MutL